MTVHDSLPAGSVSIPADSSGNCGSCRGLRTAIEIQPGTGDSLVGVRDLGTPVYEQYPGIDPLAPKNQMMSEADMRLWINGTADGAGGKR